MKDIKALHPLKTEKYDIKWRHKTWDRIWLVGVLLGKEVGLDFGEG